MLAVLRAAGSDRNNKEIFITAIIEIINKNIYYSNSRNNK
jgi:hypothetical protein